MPTQLETGIYASVSEVSDRLKCTATYVKRLLARGKMKGYKFGKYWLIPVDEDGNPVMVPKD